MNKETSQKKTRSLKTHQKVSNAIIYIVLVVLSVVWLTPFVLITMESFRTETTMQVDYILPKSVAADNYVNILFNNYRKYFNNAAMTLDENIVGNAYAAVAEKAEGTLDADKKEGYAAVTALAYSINFNAETKNSEGAYANKETLLDMIALYEKLTDTKFEVARDANWPVVKDVDESELTEVQLKQRQVAKEMLADIETLSAGGDKASCLASFEAIKSAYMAGEIASTKTATYIRSIIRLHEKLAEYGASDAELDEVRVLFAGMAGSMPKVLYSSISKPAAYMLMSDENLISEKEKATVAATFAAEGLLGNFTEDYVANTMHIDFETICEAYQAVVDKKASGEISRREYEPYIGILVLAVNSFRDAQAQGVNSPYANDATIANAIDLYKTFSKRTSDPSELSYSMASAALETMTDVEKGLIAPEKAEKIVASFTEAGFTGTGIFDMTTSEWMARMKDSDFPKWYKNTLTIAIFAALIQTFMVLCMSYTLSRTRFKGRKFLMNFMLILGMFPGFLSMIILKKVLSGWDMIGANSVYGLILVYTASSAMGYYVCKGFFDTIPKSLDEAARVDGATRAQVFFKITLPMAKPIVIYTLLTAFMSPWGDFMFAKYISNNTSAGMNVAVGLQNMIGTPEGLAAHYTEFTAAGVLVAIPVTILFMCLQKYYVEGVTGGAVKG